MNLLKNQIHNEDADITPTVMSHKVDDTIYAVLINRSYNMFATKLTLQYMKNYLKLSFGA